MKTIPFSHFKVIPAGSLGTITIDGKTVDINPRDKNIVDTASLAKIAIPAPCYHANRKKGCCKACVVEVDGKQTYACTIVPKNGMSVILNRPDLKKIRKERLLTYQENIKNKSIPSCTS